MYFSLCVGVLCLSLFCYALLCVSFYFCNRHEEIENDVDLLMLSYRCLVNVNVLRLFIANGWSAVC